MSITAANGVATTAATDPTNATAQTAATASATDTSAMETQVWQNIFQLVQSLVLKHIGKE